MASLGGVLGGITQGLGLGNPFAAGGMGGFLGNLGSIGIPAALGAGGASTAKYTETGNNTSTTIPNEPAWMSNFRQNNLLPQYNQLMGLAQRPLIGPGQVSQYIQDIGKQYANAQQNATNQLAGTGALNSSRAAQMAATLGTGKASDISNYLGSIPALNQQGILNNMSSVLGQGLTWAGRPPIGQTTVGSNQTVATGPNFLSQLLSMLGAGLGANAAKKGGGLSFGAGGGSAGPGGQGPGGFGGQVQNMPYPGGLSDWPFPPIGPPNTSAGNSGVLGYTDPTTGQPISGDSNPGFWDPIAGQWVQNPGYTGGGDYGLGGLPMNTPFDPSLFPGMDPGSLGIDAGSQTGYPINSSIDPFGGSNDAMAAYYNDLYNQLYGGGDSSGMFDPSSFLNT